MEQNEQGMEKYAVDERIDGKAMEKAATDGCPRCGSPVKRLGAIVTCPKCGTEPFEY